MLKKIFSFGKQGIKQGIKKITKGPKPKLKRTTTTKNIGGGKKIVSSKADDAVKTGKKIVGPALVGGAITIAVNKKLRDRRDARAEDSKTSATPKRKPKKQGMSEKGRGRSAKPSKIVTDKRGKAVRDKRGKAVTFGGANKGGKKSREGR